MSNLMGLVHKLGNPFTARPCTLETWGWREGKKAEKQPHVGVRAHPEARLTLFSLLFTPRAFCAFRSIGKTKTILVVRHREGCLKKWRMHCHRYE